MADPSARGRETSPLHTIEGKEIYTTSVGPLFSIYNRGNVSVQTFLASTADIHEIFSVQRKRSLNHGFCQSASLGSLPVMCGDDKDYVVLDVSYYFLLLTNIRLII